MTGQPPRELATVTRLPVHADAVDAEIVTPQEWARVQQQQAARARLAGYRGDVVTVARVTRTAVTHPRTVTASRALARNALYVPAGVVVLSRRVWEAKTNSRYERMMRAAEAAGNMDRLLEWEARAEKARDHRHKRRMDWVRAPLELVKAGALALVAFTLALLGLGVVLALGHQDPTWLVKPLQAMVWLVTTVAWVVTVAWGPLLLAVPWLVVAALWQVGRKADVTPRWLAAPGRRDDTITPSLVVTAFRDLGIAELRKRIVAMDDGGAMLLTSPIAAAGCGVEFDVTPPRGATSTVQIRARHDRLAENLLRHAHEVQLSIPAAGTVRVWAANSGALDEPIGPSPLVLDDSIRADYQRGKAPWGVSLRGDAVEMSLYQRHLLITGLSNQGKSRALIALALWLALDPKVELRIADLKGINPKTKKSDWEPFRDIASVFIAGPSDEHAIAATEMVEEGVREMKRRIERGGEWHPLVLIVDEAQNGFMNPRKDEAGRPYGGSQDNSRYFMACREMQNQGRAVDTLLWQGTQNPTNQNLPVLVREGAHLRICLAVGREEQSRMALGDKALDGGASPHLLRAGIDKGVVVVAGDGAPLAAGQASVTVRTHYIDEEATDEIAARAKARRGPVRRVDEDEARDLLDDVHEVFGEDDRVRAAHMADRLRETYPGYRGYRAINGTALVARLAEVGVVVEPGQGRHFHVRADRVLRALDMRQGVE